MRILLALLAAAGLVGCAYDDQGPVPVPGGDTDAFAASVQPWLIERCATLDCHGVGGRPLRLYAEDGLRAGGELRGEPLTRSELEANVRAFLGVDPGAEDAEHHLALRKPLALDAGGMEHVGGDLFVDRGDPDYLALRRWLDAALGP